MKTKKLTCRNGNGYISFLVDGVQIRINDSEMLKVAETLEEYQNLDTEGMLLRLPCPIGTPIWVIVDDFDHDLEIVEDTFNLHHLTMVTFGVDAFLNDEDAKERLEKLKEEFKAKENSKLTVGIAAYLVRKHETYNIEEITETECSGMKKEEYEIVEIEYSPEYFDNPDVFITIEEAEEYIELLISNKEEK